ncbi:hypothetical protein D7Z54_17985 [Salibacterium salarium]|uniref:3D domain-containing protein n=1 Tax=Salibacterium salarium TaxID=284579 RepID=A0A3R9Q1Z0_9BACI|nr:3D domain-containing protein [Salibacterium salarium]RSL31879.1 hypothetical protein D7Z54_17985 [Salibacterium salarium]
MQNSTVYRRLLMTLLFVIAVVTTASYITNVKAEELPEYFYDYIQERRSAEKDSVGLPVKVDSEHFKRHPSEQEEKYWMQEQNKAPEAELLFEMEEGLTEMVTATGYTAGYESTGKTKDDPGYGITYSGVKVRRDQVSTIAADPEHFPIGTILYIPDYGYGIVADTGAAIKGKKLDLFYHSVEDVYEEWGKRDIKVHVLIEGDGTLSEEEMEAVNKEGAVPVFNPAASSL